MKRVRSFFVIALAGVLLAPGSVEACGVCMGQSDNSQIGGAINGAIFVMLGFLGFMLAGIGGVAYSIWRRSLAPIPPHAELAEMIGTQPTLK